ncbi:oxygen-regulated protein 1 [Nematolebias whitei]|uniref:oxygen-regulated protein 1 n=1 Tax=Nematolebias whitei TaxID=451745 RepID=UPI00189A662C|nr:oxygen-regulated protein 1 [Nematolebias whitei]
MSSTSGQEPTAQWLPSGSRQTLLSRTLQPTSEASASKRVCFYKSGDSKFLGHRMVITARTFKTFDSLLDALSKKVPLPFGVRTITTPRGTHLVKALEDLQDGEAYVCSDQKRVKPLNLDEVNQRQVPWNTTRPVSAGRRRRKEPRLGPFGKRNDLVTRPAKITERATVRTPKKLEVLKNRDPSVRRTIVLQRRTAPTFDALLDHLSQILQFPVLKLFSTDGRRVDSLAALILCSGVVVAAGNEPFRLGSYNFQRTTQTAQILFVEDVEPPTLQRGIQKNTSFSSGRRSRNFSLSSERFIVNQINESQNGSLNGHLHHPSESMDTEVRQHRSPMETCVTGREDNEHSACIAPHDDDIEKSFRVNPDGSMTVEMKVRLTIKEEEMLYWSTTLSRSSLSKRTICASISGSGNNSPDSNITVAKDSSSIQEDETKEENCNDGLVRFNESYTSTTLGKSKTRLKRAPTPGPRHVNEKASVENVKVVTETEVQESTMGHYSYRERTEDGETTEEYCIVKHSSSSSNVPIPKPRRTASSGVSNKRSSIRTSEVAEALQIQNDGMEVTETVMHIYESQGCYDNYVANEEYSADGAESKPSTDLRPRSSSNDCDIDCNWQPPTNESLQRQKEEMLSLSSGPESLAYQVTNNPSSLTESEAVNTQITEKVKRDTTPKSIKKKKVMRPAGNQRSSASTNSTDKKRKEISASKHSKTSSTDKLSSDASAGKKSLNSSGNSKNGLQNKEIEKKVEKSQSKKSMKDEKTAKKGSALSLHSGNGKITSPKRKNTNRAAAKDNDHNLNTPTGRPQIKKNMSDFLQTKKSPLSSTMTINRPKSLTECRLSPPKVNVEPSEGGSIPSLNPSPAEIHQYVENWLENVSPDMVPYTEDVVTEEAESKARVVFKIGDDSESDEIKEPQTNLGDAIKKSSSCLSVPHFLDEPPTSLLHGEQRVRGLCVSMPSVRVDPVRPENTLRSHKSAEAIGPDDGDMSSSNFLSPKNAIRPVLQQLCSSIQSIRKASTSNTTSSLQNSSSLPNFSTQVVSVFGSSCKAFLSFLSVASLRDSLTGTTSGEGNQSRTTSEAMLMMESLKKISAIEDEDEQRASLTDLQSQASSQFRERWKDFILLRERLESEPLSPKVSETEFALDVTSEGGDLFEDQQLVIDELMEELNMPQDLREEIASTIQHTKSFYPAEDSTFVETIKSQSDSEEDVEKFISECKDETKILAEPESTADGINETKQETNEPDEAQEFHTETDESLKNEDVVEEIVKTGDYTKERYADEKKDEEELRGDEDESRVDIEKQGKNENQEDSEEEKSSDQESVEKGEEGTEEEMTGDEGVINNNLEEGGKIETGGKDMGSVDEETGNDEDTDEREGADETVEENSEERDQDEEDEARTISEEGQEKGEDSSSEEGAENSEEWEQNDQDEAETLINENEENEGNNSCSEDIEEDKHSAKQPSETQLQDESDSAETLINEREAEDKEDSYENAEDVEHRVEEPEEKPVNNKDDNEGEEEEEDNLCCEDVEKEEDSVEEEYEEKQVCNEHGMAEDITNEREEEEKNCVTEDAEEEVQQVSEGKKKVVQEKHVVEDLEEHRETDEEAVEETVGDEVEAKEKGERRHVTKEASEGNSNEDEEEESDQEEINDTQNNTDEEHCNQDEDDESVSEKGSAEEEELDKLETAENIPTVQPDGEENVLNERLKQVETLDDEVAEENVSENSLVDNEICKNTFEEASFQQQRTRSCEEASVEHNTESPSKDSSQGQCVDDKGTETAHETDEGDDEHGSLSHPVEISQELLDFVNDALQSYSLIFTYDLQGNIRIVPDNARVVQTKQSMIPKAIKDTTYGFKSLPSPITSDLSDYRPETSGSGGYKTQESVDITSSGEESSGKPSFNTHLACKAETAHVKRDGSKLSAASSSETVHSFQIKNTGSFSSCNADIKASREDLSYFSAASSLRADAEAETQNAQCTTSSLDKDTADGVLIDRGRWLLKENHLIRKSPPASPGMYGHLDSTSVDTAQENSSEDSLPYTKTQHSPLAAISSSELEEMAKPLNPKCNYFNMPHGSDSDPFLDDVSIRSGKQSSSCVKGKGFRVSPIVDTSKTWANRNGSLSSFASVEFQIPDRKVHPEGESSAVRQTRRTSRGAQGALQTQDSVELPHLRCGQYCPIL